jgi:hypothetical protein
VKKFSGLKGFIPRALFMFLIASITSSHPIYDKSVYKAQQAYFSQQQYNYNNNNNNNGGGGDDDNANQYNNNYDDANNGDGDDSYSYWTPYDPSSEIPSSAVNFQLVTSFVLYVPSFLSRALMSVHFPVFGSHPRDFYSFLFPTRPLFAMAGPCARRGTCSAGCCASTGSRRGPFWPPRTLESPPRLGERGTGAILRPSTPTSTPNSPRTGPD